MPTKISEPALSLEQPKRKRQQQVVIWIANTGRMGLVKPIRKGKYRIYGLQRLGTLQVARTVGKDKGFNSHILQCLLQGQVVWREVPHPIFDIGVCYKNTIDEFFTHRETGIV